MAQRRGGRPKVADEEKLSRVVAVRLSERFHDQIKKAARGAGVKPGVFVRKMVEDGKVVVRRVPEANMDAVGALARVGGNLNQLLRLVQQGAVSVAERELEEVMEELKDVRRELLGMDRSPPLRGPVPGKGSRWSLVEIDCGGGEEEGKAKKKR